MYPTLFISRSLQHGLNTFFFREDVKNKIGNSSPPAGRVLVTTPSSLLVSTQEIHKGGGDVVSTCRKRKNPQTSDEDITLFSHYLSRVLVNCNLDYILV